MAEASWFEVDQTTNALRLTAVDPSLFMRLTDLIQIISEESTEGQPFPTEFVRLLDSRIMRTLQTLHGEKKLHGDISPDNVVVTHYGGCSLLHPSSWQPKAPTPFNTPYATPVGPAHDIFSLGCLLYTVATRGAMAFHGRTEEELRGDMARGCPVIPSYIPPDIADLIVRSARQITVCHMIHNSPNPYIAEKSHYGWIKPSKIPRRCGEIATKAF